LREIKHPESLEKVKSKKREICTERRIRRNLALSGCDRSGGSGSSSGSSDGRWGGLRGSLRRGLGGGLLGSRCRGFTMRMGRIKKESIHEIKKEQNKTRNSKVHTLASGALPSLAASRIVDPRRGKGEWRSSCLPKKR